MKRQVEGLESALDHCLDMVLRHGEALESCLLHYPQYAAELEPLLRTALEAHRTLLVTPSPAAKDRARLALQAAMRRHAARPRAKRPWTLLGGVFAPLTARYPWAAVATAAMLLMVFGGTGVVAASSSSVPGQTLYPVKRLVEQARLSATLDNQAKARLHASLASRRSQELAAEVAKGSTKHAKRLSAEMEAHLERVQDNALPGLSGSVLSVTPGPEPYAPPPELLEEMKRLKLDATNKRSLQALRQKLESELRVQDRVFQQQMMKAPEPAKQGLEEAQNVTRQKYQALLQAVRWLEGEVEQPTT